MRVPKTVIILVENLYRMRMLTLVLLLSVFVSSCGIFDEEPPAEVDTSKIIMEARALSYAELPAEVKAKASDDFIYNSNTYTTIEIKKEAGWYLRLVTNNRELAKASCDKMELKDTSLYNPAIFRKLYGKYRNVPIAFNALGNEIAATRKHDQYDLFSLKRKGEIDTTYWGPMNEKPERLLFQCSQLDSARQPRAKVLQ